MAGSALSATARSWPSPLGEDGSEGEGEDEGACRIELRRRATPTEHEAAAEALAGQATQYVALVSQTTGLFATARPPPHRAAMMLQARDVGLSLGRRAERAIRRLPRA